MDPRFNKRPVSPKKVASEYHRMSVESSSQMDLLLMTYDAAIKSCDKGEKAQVSKALRMLKGALRLDKSPELVVNLLHLYMYCEKLLEEEDFAEVRRVLIPLRNAWMVRKHQDSQRGSDNEDVR